MVIGGSPLALMASQSTAAVSRAARGRGGPSDKHA